MEFQGPRLSVVVAAHDAQAELPVLLDSLCASRFRDFEVCLCDDASRDATRRVAESYAGRLDLRLTAHASNRGVTAARNAAWGLARAPLLLFVDADVRLEPDTIDRLLEARRRTGADVVDAIYAPEALDPGPFSDYYALFSHHSFLLAGEVADYNVFNGWCALARREAIAAVGGHREVPKGVEVENECLGRSLKAAGFRVRLDPAIAVAHHWGGWRKLAFVFTRRVYWWVKVYFASDRRFEDALTTRAYALGSAALPLGLLAGAAAPGRAGAALAAAGGALFLAAYAPFYAFVLRRRGPAFALWSAAVSAACSFLVCASALYSAAEEAARLLLRRGPTLTLGAAET